MKKLVYILPVLLLFTACGDGDSSTGTGNRFVACQDPRPQVCTLEYDPVCGTLTDGSSKLFATDCTACSDPSVVGFTMGACDN